MLGRTEETRIDKALEKGGPANLFKDMLDDAMMAWDFKAAGGQWKREWVEQSIQTVAKEQGWIRCG